MAFESGREAGDIGRGHVDQHCTIQPDLVHVFQKRFGRTGELQDPIKIGLLLLHQFEGRRAQQEFERLDMNVAVGDQGTCPVLSDRSCLVGLVWYRERPQYPPTRILSRPASAVAEAKYRRGMGKHSSHAPELIAAIRSRSQEVCGTSASSRLALCDLVAGEVSTS